MVPNIIIVMSSLVASLQGDGTGLTAEELGFQLTLFQVQSK